MADFDIQRKLCVNNCVVPARQDCLAIMDPYDLNNSGKECVDATLVKFAAAGPDSLRSWLQKILHLPSHTWWKINCSRVPLLLEVLELIRCKRSKKHHDLKQPNTVLPVKVRGRVLWFQNTIRCVTLALLEDEEKKKGQDKDQAQNLGHEECHEQEQGQSLEAKEDKAITDLQWFLKELRKDTELLLEAAPGPEMPVAEDLVPQTQAQPRTSTPRDCLGIADQCLERLRAHPQCKSAGYFHSRRCLWVTRSGGLVQDRKEFRVIGLKRKRAASAYQDTAEPVQTAFEHAVSLALRFLGPQAPDALGDGDAQPLCNAETDQEEPEEEHQEEPEEEQDLLESP